VAEHPGVDPGPRARRARTAAQVRHPRRGPLLALLGVSALVAAVMFVAFVPWPSGGTRLAAGSKGAGRVASRTPDTSASLAASASVAGEEATTPAAAKPSTTGPIKDKSFVIAWQPSHQNDTGRTWHEYVICGDIVDRAIAQLDTFTNVKVWDLNDGLTGSNNYRPKPINPHAFDVEIAAAGKAKSDLLIAVHNDGGAPSGVMGECSPGDAKSAALARKLVAAICERTGLPNRGVRTVRLYSFDKPMNKVPMNVLLEIGDNSADRAFLLNPAKRQLIATAMAGVLVKLFGTG